MKKDRNKEDKKPDKNSEIQNLNSRIEELLGDLQRTRADFENYRKRTEADLERTREAGKSSAILKLLPVIDNIERAIGYAPEALKHETGDTKQGLEKWEKWGAGVTNLMKNLEKSMESLGVKRIEASPGTPFDPDVHEAVSSEEGDGQEEVIAEELQAGYKLGGRVIRHSMVKVTFK